MKYFIVLSFLMIKVISGQTSPTYLDSIDLPKSRIIIFDKTIYPKLTKGQRLKYNVIKLREDIQEMKKEIILINNKIKQRQREIDSLFKLYEKETFEYSSVLLGLYSVESRTKRDSILHDEKSILWGVFKWGKNR